MASHSPVWCFFCEGNPAFGPLLSRETYPFHPGLERAKAVCYLPLGLVSMAPLSGSKFVSGNLTLQ